MRMQQQQTTIFRKIEAAEKGTSLVVHYDVIGPGSSSLNQNHYERNTNSGSFKQVINISKPANQSVDLRQLATKVLQQCDLIPRLRLPELMAALLQLLNTRRRTGGGSNGVLSSTAAAYEYPFVMQNFLSTTSTLFFTSEVSSSNSGNSISNGDERNSSSASSSSTAPSFDATSVSLGQLDLYIELLYEELEEKIRGALAILALVATRPEHLGRLAKNDTLLCALSRVLREDGKKSLELSIYIAAIFAHLSNFVDFHFAISNYKVGSTCLELLYFEVLREESWCTELSSKHALAESQLENLKAKLAYEKLLVSYQNLVKKQNLLFRYALLVLLNISEDLTLEVKVVGKGVIPLLLKLLERHSQELLLIVTLYLKKLSVFGENAAAMRASNGVAQLVNSLSPLLFLDNELLVFNTLKLLYNLALDREVRGQLIRSGIFSKLVSFFSRSGSGSGSGGGGIYSSVIVSLFYLISCEQQQGPQSKQSKTLAALFGSHHPQLMGLLLERAVLEGPRGPAEYRPVLFSLLANLAANRQLAQAMVVDCSDAYGELLKVTFALLEKGASSSSETSGGSSSSSSLALLRLWRNISCHGDPLLKLSLLGHTERFLLLMLAFGDQLLLQRTGHAEMLVECAAILTNLSGPACGSNGSSSSSAATEGSIDWLKLYRRHPVDAFLRQVFSHKWTISTAPNRRAASADTREAVLRAVLLVVAAGAHQREMTTFLFEQNIVDRLIDLLNANQENDEIVLHVIYCFYVFVKVGVELREQIFQQTKLADYLIDLMYDRNYRIKALCTATLDMVADDGSDFAGRIKQEKFAAYNAKWLAAIHSADRASADGEAASTTVSSGHSMLEDLFIYPDLFLKVDSLLADSSSENGFGEEEDSDDNLVVEGGGGGGGGTARRSPLSSRLSK